MDKVIAYCGTENLYQDMYTSAKSFLYNTDVERIYFITECDEKDFPFELSPEMNVINVNKQKFFKKSGPNMKNKYTYMAMMRAALCHVLTDEDCVLSLDCDTVCSNPSCNDIWDTDLEDYYVAGIIEPLRSYKSSNPTLQYFNAGVTLYNLKKMRDGKADEIIDVLNKRKYTWLDQDVVSYLCQAYIKELPGEYNVCDFTEKTRRRPKIIHYAGNKMFHGEQEWLFYQNMTLERARSKRGRK